MCLCLLTVCMALVTTEVLCIRSQDPFFSASMGADPAPEENWRGEGASANFSGDI